MILEQLEALNSAYTGSSSTAVPRQVFEVRSSSFSVFARLVQSGHHLSIVAYITGVILASIKILRKEDEAAAIACC